MINGTKSLKISEAVHYELKTIACKRGESVKEVAERAISNYCKRVKSNFIKEENEKYVAG